MIYFLIGMPASGKTSVGKRLSGGLKIDFIDLDNYISAKENKTIPELFKQKGEDYFRKSESNSLKEISKESKDVVVSVGGGTPCFYNNMDVMLAAGKVFYLYTTAKNILKRVKQDTAERPLFSNATGDKLLIKVEKMLVKRDVFYKKAHHLIDTDDREVAEVAREIANKLKA